MRLLIAALLLLAVCAGPASAATKCPTGARCGAVEVPIDRSGTVPGTYSIAYSVLPATGPRAGTIVLLTGGPGQSAVVYTEALGTLLEPIRATHDIVLVDQRGTGRSGTVECADYVSGDEEPADLCAAPLGDTRAFLTTAETARDLDAVRTAVGVEQIIPLGISYGTKVAGEYARRFPQHTAAVVLDSPVSTGPIDFLGLIGIRAMPRVLREACAASPCRRTVKDAGAAMFAAVARVGRGLRSEVVMGHDIVGRTRVHDSSIHEQLERIDVDPLLRAELPAALASLARGDALPFLHLRERSIDRPPRSFPDFDEDEDEEIYFSDSRYYATACLETQLPWATTSAPGTRLAAKRAFLDRLGPQPFAPFRPALVWKASDVGDCLRWPATAAPEPVPDAGPDVSVLVLSGRADIRTPLELAQQVAATYPRATLLDVPHVGHSVLTVDPSRCALRGLTAFLAGRTPERCTAPPAIPAARYLPATARGLSVRAIARHTVEGVLHDHAVTRKRLGPGRRFELKGLRFGWVEVQRRRLKLHDVSWFDGVRVSGTVSLTGRGSVRVRVDGGRPRAVRL